MEYVRHFIHAIIDETEVVSGHLVVLAQNEVRFVFIGERRHRERSFRRVPVRVVRRLSRKRGGESREERRKPEVNIILALQTLNNILDKISDFLHQYIVSSLAFLVIFGNFASKLPVLSCIYQPFFYQSFI